jgi:hypothetical protein
MLGISTSAQTQRKKGAKKKRMDGCFPMNRKNKGSQMGHINKNIYTVNKFVIFTIRLILSVSVDPK